MSPSLRNTISVKYFSFVPSDSSKLLNMLSRPKLQLWWDLYSFSFCWEIFSWYKIHITVVINMSTCPDWFILQHLHPVTSPQPPSQKKSTTSTNESPRNVVIVQWESSQPRKHQPLIYASLQIGPKDYNSKIHGLAEGFYSYLNDSPFCICKYEWCYKFKFLNLGWDYKGK